ncbi:MAG: 2-oxoacid:ferredoxin oxidoreductase subunit beta [Proteobacteria bacterium]|nr:2-oxoacid:ferredoxin oxidoreductase subunit beta [Pseudomonadota bacterium]
MTGERHLIYQYLRHDKKFPHVWCPGCGNGIVLGALIRAVHNSGLTKNQIVLVSGIGCAGRMTTYVDFNTLHTTHGRALTFATGIKLARPELHVIVVMGDGDATAIGGNHLIHAARRNVNMTALVINNHIYGMTGGQYSPTTPYGLRATTAPHGHIEHTFNISHLVDAAGASFVARGTVYHVNLLDRLVEKALFKKGFSLVEIMSSCPTHFNKLNQLGSAVDSMHWLKEHAVPVEKAKDMSREQVHGKFRVGVLADRDIADYQAEYEQVRTRAKDDRVYRPAPKEVSRILESYQTY